MNVTITQNIDVDDCIAQEIVFLNSIGIHTLNSCCGHGKEKPNAIIKPSSKTRAVWFDYKPCFVESCGYSGEWIIELKSKCNCKKSESEGIECK